MIKHSGFNPWHQKKKKKEKKKERNLKNKLSLVYTPVMPVVWEAEAGGSLVQSQSQQLSKTLNKQLSKTLSQNNK